MATPEQLFERFRRDADDGALAAVFDALAPQLLLVAAHLAPAGVEPEDLVQATFLDAIEHAARWDGRRPLRPWLAGILVNHARLERRRQARPIDTTRLGTAPVSDPGDTVAAVETTELVAEAVASMPRHYRQVLTLRLVHGLTPAQIARALDCPVATARSRLVRGLELLRKVLPAGIAASLAGLLSAGRGLAQVRAAVLETARLGPLSSTTAAGVAAGGFAMKKIVVAAVAALCVTALWLAPPLRPTAAPPPRRDAAEPATVAARLPGESEPSRPTPAAGRRLPVSAPARAATGSAELEMVWKHDGSPAAHVRVSGRGMERDGGGPFEARADQRGLIELEDLVPGRYFLSGRKLWYEIEIHAGQRLHERIEVEAGLRLHGLVVDTEGHPVAGAGVYVQYFPDPAEREPRRVATSGPDGRFRAAANRGGYAFARRDGYAPGPCQSPVLEGDVELKLVLRASTCALRGVVLDASGHPAPGVRLTILGQTDSKACPTPVELSSDASGAFATRELAPGEHLLVARATDHAVTPLAFTARPYEPLELRVALQLGATLSGTVRAGARPVAAKLELRPAWAGGGESWNETLRPIYHTCAARTTTDASGRYRFQHVPVGPVTLRAVPDSPHLPAERKLALGDGEARTCDFAVGTGGSLRGRLVGPRNQPLAGWRVFFDPAGGGIAGDAETDAHGMFVRSGLDAAEYTVSAYPPGTPARWGWARAEGVRPDSDDLVLRAAYRPEDCGHVVGRAVRADGSDAVRAALWLWENDETRGHVGQLALRAGGAFDFGPLPPGRYRITLRIGQDGGVDLGRRDLGPRQTLDLGTVRAAAAGTLELHLRTPSGRDLEPTRLFLRGSGDNHGTEFEPTAGGGWRSMPLPAGEYTLSAWGPHFAPLEQRVVIAAERATPVEVIAAEVTPVRFELRCPHSGEAELRVRDAAGKRVWSHVVLLDPKRPAAVTCGLPAGRHAFEARRMGSDERRNGTFEVGAEARTVSIQLGKPR